MKRLVVAAALGLSLLVTPAVVSAAGPLDGLTVPQVDPALVFVEPTPDQPNYDARLAAFLSATVPDQWNGMPVQFYSTLNDTGVDQLGLPTSEVAPDPNNPQFVYQRFQNWILFFNGAEGATSILPLS